MEIAKRERVEQLRPILCQAKLPVLDIVEMPLQQPKRVLDLGPELGDPTVDLSVDRMNLAALGSFAHETPHLYSAPSRHGSSPALNVCGGGAARQFASDRHFHRGIQAEATCRVNLEKANHYQWLAESRSG